MFLQTDGFIIYNLLFIVPKAHRANGAEARGIEAEPPKQMSAKRETAKVMERIARRERAKHAKRLAQR
jgi:hypothetical protein